MDILEQVETAVQVLMARIDELSSENEQTRARYVESEKACSVFQEENRALRRSLEQERALRQEALSRIDAMIRKIQEHQGAE